VPTSTRGRYAVATAMTVGLVLVGSAGCSRGAASGDYPQRPIQVVVPYPAGSGIDTTTRALVDIINAGDAFAEDLQVVNKDGGGGTVGTTEILNAEPDGYTIGVVPDGPLTLVPQTEEVAYDPEAVTLLNEVITSPIMFVVPEASPFQDLGDLVDAAQDAPGSITIGEGPLNYKVPADAFEQETGARLKHVSFDGDQATTTALLGNNLDVGVMQLASALPQLASGGIRALGVTADAPVDLIPDVATFSDQGVDIVWEAINVVVAPDGLDEEVSDRLEGAFEDAAGSDEFAAAAAKLGLIVSGAGPEQAREHLATKTEDGARVLGAGQ